MVKISSMIGFFCLIGCLYQVYDITQFYLQYKVRRDVAYDYATHIEFPALDIMVPLAMAINFTKLFAAYPEEINSICSQINEDDVELNYTIDDFHEKCAIYLKQSPIVISHNLALFIKVKDIKEFSVDLEEQLIEIEFTRFGGKKDHCNSTRYYNGLAIFVRFECLDGTKSISVNSNFITLNAGVVAKLVYSFGTYFGVRFSDQSDLPVFEHSKYFIITRESGLFSLTLMSFVKTVMSSLEYPYETNCRYYNKGKSISKCMAEYTLGQSTPYLLKTGIHEWNEHPDHLGFTSESNGNKSEDDSNDLKWQEFYAIINCNQLAAATECEKTTYAVEGKISDHTKSAFGLINIEPSWRPNIYLSVHPILPLSEYLIFIGSIAGIWLGVSIHERILVISTYVAVRFSRLKHIRKE